MAQIKPMSAWYATWIYTPTAVVADVDVTIPPVACGRGYRQLTWREEIRPTDEFFGGRRESPCWIAMGDRAGSLYRPTIANSIYAPWAVIRRKLSVP